MGADAPRVRVHPGQAALNAGLESGPCFRITYYEYAQFFLSKQR
jgi:hypothetical protein